MKKLLVAAGIVAVTGVAFLGAVIFVPPVLTKPQLPDAGVAVSGLGKYVAQLSDCAACHTAPGGKPFAGGLHIESPMGTIIATNITPDAKSGIGGWTLDQFRAALVDGVGKGGQRLYPAMPYENYRKLSEADIDALYDYLMHEVPAVTTDLPETALMFPFNQRWGMRLWNWVALSEPGFKPTAKGDELARGEYLVDGPGHCAACHSPRNLFMAQDGVDSSSAGYLAGGQIDGWDAPGLRGPNSEINDWTEADLKSYLLSGRNTHAGVGGEMALVVENSLQYLNASDADAITRYLMSLNEGHVAASSEPNKAEELTTKQLTEAVNLSLGARLYLDNCSACHFVNGKGAPEVFPALDKASIVNADSSKGLLNTILYGAEMPSTATRPAKLRMPGFSHRLSDQEVAELATFLRQAWSNKAAPVAADEVKTLRDNRKGHQEASKH
ncbi:c-type cytochrome [Agrobacterium tumefaciens]|uniref:c-type cytochrome n=1 Tax=Rhizobium/Agrobacterium group TaxID=227290 RepID=UPI00157434E4|nr:cytochrome c [Agrobacterium tumefaciens]NTA83750.1 c-type cytochrome [Agrobacterium tumefaciens]